MIYLDHNATTPLAPRVFKAMVPYMRELWGNPSSPYRFGNSCRGAIEQSRERIAEYLCCKPNEIVFCSSGTEADNIALRGVAHALRDRGEHIITTEIEHPAVLNTCRALEHDGYRVTYLPVNLDGLVNIGLLTESICKDTILVSVMHANNETGVVQPIEKIASIARNHGVLFHTDAVQTLGKLPGRLVELGANLVTFSGHKLYGPKGIAALYVQEGTPIVPTTTGGGQERGMRAGTENVAAVVGLAEAIALAFEVLDSEEKRLCTLRDRLEEQIQSIIPDVLINGKRVQRVPNTSNITFKSIDGESVVLGMDLQGICLSTGSACSTGDAEPSHVLLAMGIKARDAQGSIRISLGRKTTKAAIDTTTKALASTVDRLRSISSI